MKITGSPPNYQLDTIDARVGAASFCELTIDGAFENDGTFDNLQINHP